jgi:hypothetical protein
MSEEKSICPKCGSALIVRLANVDHCNQCAHDFNLDRNPIATHAQTEKRGLWTLKHSP